MVESLLFDINKYAINDGPGIRLTIFFKGCTLNCAWCHNPESISPKVQKMYNVSNCIGAVKCIEACPNDALSMTKNGVITNGDVCKLCGKCAEVCPAKAFEMLGYFKPLNELLKIIDNEAIFLDQSGGGITFSGGEPLMHAAYLIEALKECGKRYYHRVVDTTAFAKKEVLLEVAEHTEMFLIDLKVMDSLVHKEFTGVGNEKILSNIRALSKNNCDIIFRIPLISGVNSDRNNIVKTAEFINSLAGNRKIVNILPYHKIAEHKLMKLGEESNFRSFTKPTEEEIQAVILIFESYGIKATVGG